LGDIGANGHGSVGEQNPKPRVGVGFEVLPGNRIVQRRLEWVGRRCSGRLCPGLGHSKVSSSETAFTVNLSQRLGTLQEIAILRPQSD
jgi:hypothetical protein